MTIRRITKAESPAKFAARRYIDDATGKEISRRQYEQEKRGGITAEEKARIRKNSKVPNKVSHYSQLVQSYKRVNAMERGVKMKDIKVRGKSEEAERFKKYVRELSKLTDAELKDKKYGGKLSNILIALNLRKEEWGLNVGEYPEKNKTTH